MAGRHRSEPTHGPWVLVGSFVVIAAVLVALFRWAAPTADVTRVVDEAAPSSPSSSGTDVTAASDATATDEATARRLGNFQRGHRIERVPEPVCSRVPVSTSMTVVTYNIKSGHVSNLAAIAGVIRSAGADVVLLQEVDRNRHGSGQVDQAARLAGLLGGWSHAFGQNVAYGGSAGYGTAIISRWPIVSSQNWHLPNAPGGQQRGLLKAVVSVEGVHTSFYSTHLQPEMSALRTRQARAVAGIVAGDANPRILGGDMNAWPTSHWIGILRSQFTDTWAVVGRGKGATHPARGPRTRIDFLMHRGDGLAPSSADVLGSLASDHRAVRATYALDGATEKKCTTPTS